MKKIPIGELRHPFRIEYATETPNEFGEKIQSPWRTLVDVRAKIEPLSGRELWNMQQSQPDVTHRITIRHVRSVTSRMRGIYDGRIFNFLSVLNIEERNIYLEISAMEEV